MEKYFEKRINLRKNLTKKNFRHLAFRFFRETKFQTNYICVLFKTNFIIKSDKNLLNNEIYLGTEKLLDITYKDDVMNYVDYVTEEVIAKILNKKDKSKCNIIINYLYLDKDTYENHHKKIVDEHIKNLDIK